MASGGNAQRDPVRSFQAFAIVGSAVTIFTLLLIIPVVAVYVEALSQGWEVLWAKLNHRHTIHAMKLTLEVVAWTVPLNLIFGFAAAWVVTHFRFPGRGLLVTLIDVPFTVSTVVAGLMIVILFGPSGWFGPYLIERGIRVLHGTPAIVMATVFVTMPIIAREIMPVMQARGASAEYAALTLGANPWQIWTRVTFPAVRTAVIAGTILCIARSMGEFGAVAVVSGNVRGRTQTMSLQVDGLYNDYDFVGAFGLAALMASIGLLSLAFSGGAKGVASLRKRMRPQEDEENTHLRGATK